MNKTDPPTVTGPPLIEYDPIRAWLHKAEQSHTRMHNLIDETIDETKWRKECIRMAIAMGATQEMVARRLGVTREQVSKLAR